MHTPNSKIFMMSYRGICPGASLISVFLRLSGTSPNKSRVLVFKARPRAIIGRTSHES